MGYEQTYDYSSQCYAEDSENSNWSTRYTINKPEVSSGGAPSQTTRKNEIQNRRLKNY